MLSIPERFIKSLQIFILTILLSILLTIFVPPLLILRYCVSKSAQWLRKDLECMLRPLDAQFCQDYDMWHVEPDHTVLYSVILDGKVTLAEIHSRYRKPIGKWSNRKLQQRIENWMGYKFWKNDKDFCIEDHIRLYEEENEKIRDEKWLAKTKQKLLRKPYLKDKSPWEILLIPNFKSELNPQKEFCVVLIRIHHIIGDGTSLRNIIKELSDEDPCFIEPRFSSSSKANLITKLLEGMTLVCKAPYIFATLVVQYTDRNKSPWNCKGYTFSKISSSANSKQLYLPYLKDIKNKFKVSLNSVILLGVSSIIRQAFLKLKIPLPESVHLVFPIPMPNHPDELCYHSTIIPFPFPVGISDPEERLKEIERNLTALKNSLVPKVVYLSGYIFGCLPCFLRRPRYNAFQTGSVTVFPGPTKQTLLFGRKYYNESFCIAVYNPVAYTGLFITCLSDFNNLNIDSHFDRSIFNSDSDVAQLYESMYEDYRQIAFVQNKSMFTPINYHKTINKT